MNDKLTVQTAKGPVQGTQKKNLSIWKGIPYAASTATKNRWQKPQAHKPWEDVRDATNFGPICPQIKQEKLRDGLDAIQSENCLSLNIWSPDFTPKGEKKPVMFWIHGGAYFFGASTQKLFDGTNLATNEDVVVVTFNYRLGALGFLNLSSLNKGETTFTDNIGMWDTLAALEWVKENISNFGGDPNNVTAFGESAGAGILTALMVAPQAEGLFHRAIAESSPAAGVLEPERAEEIAGIFLDAIGVEPENIEELPKKSLADILEAGDTMFEAYPAENPGLIAFCPTVDNELLTDNPIKLFQQGKSHNVPLIIGTNKDEASLFRMLKTAVVPSSKGSVEAMLQKAESDYPEFDMPSDKEIEALYTTLNPLAIELGVSGDLAFRLPSITAATNHSKHSPTWVYRFDFAPKFFKLIKVGATHGAEMFYVWNNLPTKLKDPTYKLGGLTDAKKLSRRMQGYWAEFAKTGDPNKEETKEWPQYTEDQEISFIFDKHDRAIPFLDSRLKELWRNEMITLK